MAQNIKGPGILWVTGNISKAPNNPLTEEVFLRWYDDDHIAEIVETPGIHSALRLLHVDKTSPYGTPECPKPFLATYPMPDLAFTQGQDFKKIRVKSDILPGTGICYDMADLDVGYYAFVGQSGNGKKGSARYYAVSAIEPADGTTDDEVNKFFDQQATTVSKTENYQRSLRFRLLYARTNAQSRALKGLPTTDEPAPEPPTWMAVHEFSTKPSSDVRETIKNDSHEVLKKAKQNQINAYNLAKALGQGKYFEDAESGAP